MPSTAEHINARGDADLQARFIAMAEMEDIPNPAGWVMANMPMLITQEIGVDDQTITTVHAYAAQSREAYIAATPPPPGLNPGAVLDSHIKTAIMALHTEQNPSEG